MNKKMNNSVSPSAGTPSMTWVYFLAGGEQKPLLEKTQTLPGPRDVYQISEVVHVCGEKLPLQLFRHLVRVETPSPFLALKTESSEVMFKGNVRHLQYTPASVRAELQKKSAAPYPASPSTLAVLIPIKKSEAWWSLSQDERQKHFEKKAEGRNHTAIGQDYANLIYRKLYHSRYLEGAGVLGYDFLTYFEFDEKDRPLFKALLSELRNVEVNPEWKFVDFEMEIWMSKKEISEGEVTG